jgi:hypothetical protein
MSGEFENLPAVNEIAEQMTQTLECIGGGEVRRAPRSGLADVPEEGGCPEGNGEKKSVLESSLHKRLDEAERYRYDLIVQREAMRLRHHAEVACRYPLPEVAGRPPASGGSVTPPPPWPGVFSRGLRRKFSG